ncbi:MAG: hypothetical protein JSV08_06275 [Acidobacteriota bacterium]|nr:MAG: hypothetical protein JSV08_06275 [Acidobacteriota bacterium]
MAILSWHTVCLSAVLGAATALASGVWLGWPAAAMAAGGAALGLWMVWGIEKSTALLLHPPRDRGAMEKTLLLLFVPLRLGLLVAGIYVMLALCLPRLSIGARLGATAFAAGFTVTAAALLLQAVRSARKRR